IHGETVHKGKTPKRGAGGTLNRTELIRMRRQMKEAIEKENYERAKELRDEIKKLEEAKE
ncbi:MAG TPA: UvrB/UvrC motif-containing protein, partial [Pirellulales bacterium]